MTSLFETLGRNKAMLGLIANKNSPKMLFVGGVAGMVGSTVLACRATLKVEQVLHETQRDISITHHIRDQHEDQYSENDRKKDTAIIYVRSSAKIALLYAPAVIVGGISIAVLTKSHNLLEERNIALMAAYSALDKGFREYRSRVVERYGEDVDREMRYDTEIVASDDAKGKAKTTVRVSPDSPSIYAMFYDEGSRNWSPDPEINKLFLKNQQNYLNDLLRVRGHVMLNEVYDRLDLPQTKAGAIVGWMMNSEDGDHYIDFGVFGRDGSDRIRDFMNGREGAVLLDFNVDGVIFDKLPEVKEAIRWRR